MFRLKPVILVLCATLMIVGCSKRSHPSPSVVMLSPVDKPRTAEKSKPVEKKVEPVATEKTEPVKSKPTTATPKVILVDDRAAKKSVDGRYYYDLGGHRYWRNNKDGKYYLFNKSMYTDDAFKPKAN